MRLKLPKTKGMLRREAATWLARLQSGRDPEVDRKLRRWLDSDPAHAAAFDRVRRSYDQAALLRHSPEIEAPDDRRQHARIPPQRYAIAAAAAFAVLASAALLHGGRAPFPLERTEAVMLATKVGEIRSVSLGDGSKVILDSATNLEVELGRSERTARLKSGRARFEIAAAKAPFLVQSGATTVTANGGTIDVEREGDQSRVEVLAGVANVHQADQRALADIAVGPGHGVTADPTAFAKQILPKQPDWTRGMLQFDGTELADAVALANRYSERHIILGADLNGLKVTGAFRAGDSAGLAKALAATFGLSVRQAADGSLFLSSPINKIRGQRTFPATAG